jgi:3-deoxy-manno-octulosonate cytidylyltransferase (CMP-KDO synthetase)
MNVAGIIPARYDSTRLPGKPLKMIGDTSLIMRVFNQCSEVESLNKIVVATDDDRILEHVQQSGGEAVMTSREHGSGTERCFEALGIIEGDFDFVINIQGDEPFINPIHIQRLISSLKEDTEIATLCMPILTDEELNDPGIPKLITDKDNNAIYFSRAVIPHIGEDGSVKRFDQFKYLKHIGIYAYSKDVLATIVKLPSSKIEIAEQLEQLRWLYNGLRISTVEVPSETSISVDTIEDLERARKFLQ